MKAKLCTSEGELVTEVEMPPFAGPPDVVIWGQRVFVFIDEGEAWDEVGIIYSEAFTWFVPPEMGEAMIR